MKRIKDTLIFAVLIAILILILISFDQRVRTYATQVMQSPIVANTGMTITSVGSALLMTARDQSVEHAPFVVFTVVGLVLFVFMFRT